ncbi:hypothetical protein ACT6NV_05460 [Robiginitalea sp. IMCC44478]|uniref:hypothetical protein n=1 Tax=Robiginitalea sp. IMCC44478 TaxID=3459122 RepID=UPI0040418AEC
MRKVTTSIILSLLLSGLAIGQQRRCFDFVWEGGTVSGRYIPKIVMNIPVKVDSLPHEFTMQLDLGAVTTEFYGNTIQPYLDTYPSLKEKVDSSKTFTIQNQKNVMLGGMHLKMGDVKYENIDIGLFAGYGDSLTVDSVKTSTIKHIGTIAPDLFQGRILIINYPENQICLSDELPGEYKNLNFQDFILEDGRINIPLRINDSTEMLMFDTGSSMFSLLTTKDNADKISDGAITDSLSVNSWGEYLSVFGSEVTTKVMFGDKTLPSTLVYYIDDPRIAGFFKQNKIWGITGNAYFSNSTLIIDYKTKKIAIK